MENKKNSTNKLIIGLLLFVFIITGFSDLLLHNKTSYSSIMAMNTTRLYFYTFFLLIIGCWLLYKKWFVGIGFICLATFSSYFTEYISIHNYFASIAVYIGIIIDVVIQKKKKWLIPLIIVGILQGIAFQTGWFDYYMVGFMEFIGLCLGSIFVIKTIR
ncbi:hypothetical protein [Hyunsoonleella pacifica]|uniref:Uncharacterized protein n=1 Tax=Hyunsoonleella pacifica TaxID=1080224 RepID=A0A4Q9FMZ4_9FLAO|nr:hypothetical protein [Hyunsoonleella pacifica]TBN15617.1 hypothetical protein EYD46_10835 [Hyunsoonleella pacifica]GGD21299.1 hypothetical protein GCM10011368_24060 [Hyunsoonleella pacifica]